MDLSGGSWAGWGRDKEVALYVATSAGAAATARGAASLRQRFYGFYRKAHVGQIDINAFHFFHQFFTDTEREVVDFYDFIVIGRLVQSQRKTRAASATGRKINTNARLGLIRKERFQFFAGVFRKINHKSLRV